MQEGQLFLCSFFLAISSEWISKRNSCALHNFLMVWNILLIFGRGIDIDLLACRVQETILTILVMYLSSLKPKSLDGITPIQFELICEYLVGTYIRSNRSVTCKKDNSCFIFLVISLEQISKPNSCTHQI